MDFIKYLKQVRAQRQINKLAKKYKNKKIVLYGAGLFAKILLENYNCSKLNIVAICDKKYTNLKEPFCGYQTISPQVLTDFDCDVILVSVIEDVAIGNYLRDDLLIGTKNEDKEVIAVICNSIDKGNTFFNEIKNYESTEFKLRRVTVNEIEEKPSLYRGFYYIFKIFSIWYS